jgi:chaperonin GroEL
MMLQPAAAIAANAGRDPTAVLDRMKSAGSDVGFDARSGTWVNMVESGIADPGAVSIAALRNAASVATPILTTQTLIVKKPEYIDPTAGPALGGGAERLGRP